MTDRLTPDREAEIRFAEKWVNNMTYELIKELDAVRAELYAARAELAELTRAATARTAERTGTDSFACPECGPGVAVDEDRCCARCGRDTDGAYLLALMSRVAELEEALRPFAETTFDEKCGDGTFIWDIDWIIEKDGALTVGDFRRAAAALAKETPDA